MRKTVLNLIVGAFALAATSVALADVEVTTPFNMPTHVTCNVSETDCYNNPGPKITLDGEILLGGLQVELILKNNVKGTHTAEVTYSSKIVLVPLGEKIVIPKQPVLGGVGGNPHVWLQFCDAKEKALSGEIYLGRCVQGLSVGGDFLNPSIAKALIAASGCENHPGPVITFGGNIKLSGMKAKLIFRNNVKGTHEAEAKVVVTLIPDGKAIEIPKQPSQGGAGGNPLIYLQFQHCDGDPIGGEIFLGRCNKL